MNLEKQLFDVNYLLDRGYKSFSLDNSKIRLTHPNFVKKDRKTYIDNFDEVCESIGRDPENIRLFLSKELQMGLSFMQDGTLKIDGMVKSVKNIEDILKIYVINHVMCYACKSCKTETEKVGRIMFLVCTSCKAKKALNKE